MAKTLVALAVFTLLVAAVRTPAAASITSASVSGPSFSGPCPTTMVFKGTVTGTPGTTFKLSFNRLIKGVQQLADESSASIPACVSLAVSDSFVIVKNASGSTFDQIWVHGISGGQSDVYSNK